MNPFSLEGKTILVTGASSGIGRAIAVECSGMGGRVVLTARSEDRLNETLSLMEGDGHSLIIADLGREDDRRRLVSEVPKLDGLVNCAGIVRTALFQFIDYDSLSEIMNVNFVGPALISAQLIESKKLTRRSSIVFISSISGIMCAGVGNSMYSASKGAVNGMMKNMALDLAAKGIRVNSVNPGMIETPFFDGGMIDAAQLEEDRKRYPLKRYGRPEEVAYAAVYLLSDASSWMTGSNIVIDGGYTLN